nr:MAG TPA: hypothetical protein [Caudoviricetes sp.]
MDYQIYWNKKNKSPPAFVINSRRKIQSLTNQSIYSWQSR